MLGNNTHNVYKGELDKLTEDKNTKENDTISKIKDTFFKTVKHNKYRKEERTNSSNGGDVRDRVPLYF